MPRPEVEPGLAGGARHIKCRLRKASKIAAFAFAVGAKRCEFPKECLFSCDEVPIERGGRTLDPHAAPQVMAGQFAHASRYRRFSR